MNIKRTGECPIFLKYITEQAMVPRARQPTAEFLDLTRYNFNWIDVPSFQRGLVWDEDLLESLLASRSIFLGNAIFGMFPVPRGTPGFAGLPVEVAQYAVLIDGLQRFSIGTALLSILAPLVMGSEPERAADAGHFSALRVQAATWAPVFQHNDHELSHHTRVAVADSYAGFRKRLKSWIIARLDRGEAAALAQEVIHLFLQRQIAPDYYLGFGSVFEVVSTFIGLNTVRVQLNIVDWLRSVIVDKGGEAGWTPEQIQALENRFSEIFNQDSGAGPKSELIPLASIFKEVLTEMPDDSRRHVFPSWGPGFQTADVERLLNFVEQIWEHDGNPFVREIRLCGAIPFAGLILYFYRRLLQEDYEPSFLKGGDQDDAALLPLLRSNYRVVLEGRVARTRKYALDMLLTDQPMADIADSLSRNFLGKGLAETVDRDWLVASLKGADKKRARLVFNACLLPEHGNTGPFTPHRYGRNAEDHQIDHLIPASVLRPHQPGGPEGDLLMNFAPIRRTTNVRQLNIQCSHKLAPGGVYAIECANDPDTHPYVHWLVAKQGALTNRLDDQALLQTAATPDLAAQRIDWLANRLLTRL